MSDIAFTYDEKKNPHGYIIDGVPLRDLTMAEFERLTPERKKAVQREPFYVKVSTTKKAAALKEAKEGD